MNLRSRFSIAGWYPKSTIARNISILMGGTAIAQLIAILASPILTRIYTPGEFGTLQIFISIMSLVVVAASGRYEVAILIPADDQEGICLVVVALICVAITSTLAFSIVAASYFVSIIPAGILALKSLLWLLPVSILGGGTYQVLNFWAVRRGDYKQVSASKVTQASLQVATQVGIGLLAHGPCGLLAGDSVGRLSGSSRFIRSLLQDHRDHLRGIRLRKIVSAAIRYRRYPLISMWGALINSSGLALPSLFLVRNYSAQNTGWFALVNRVLGVPTALVGISLLQIFAAETARLSRLNPKSLMSFFLKTTRRMLVFGFVPCLLFMATAPWAFQFAFGHSWRGAGEYARYLSVMFYAGFVDAPVTMTLLILEHQKAQFAWDILRLLITLTAISLPSRFGGSVGTAVVSYGMAMTLMYGVHWIMSFVAIAGRIRQCPVASTAETLA